MTKLPILSAREIIKALERAGFQFVSQKGSHIKMKKKEDCSTSVVIIPNHDEIATGTLKSIIRQSKLTPEEFISLFR
ncbi:type II toxin-antitoxin system HicA family toxin [Methanolobus bombayensis]|uniref:type II toxin-antitoxin system HicA family toxin n=1 Tax=Methanolobus bombayensis TaxID=38023 RepID=UPI001AE72FA2|nr:type II toxin-antitoxin system HicA family toxin [Methanolobus bombayensis]MBP1908141.1 putative RNA binding protein YcfA (HicA-like mRNA interferase family) [Methanolobus bombayensis]